MIFVQLTAAGFLVALIASGIVHPVRLRVQALTDKVEDLQQRVWDLENKLRGRGA